MSVCLNAAAHCHSGKQTPDKSKNYNQYIIRSLFQTDLIPPVGHYWADINSLNWVNVRNFPYTYFPIHKAREQKSQIN